MKHRPSRKNKFVLEERDICEITGKIIYSSKNDARHATKSIKDIAPYECEHCFGWHVTSKRNKFYNGVLSEKRIEKKIRMVSNNHIHKFDFI